MRIIKVTENASAFLLLMGGVVGLVNVIARYVFKNAFIWGDEATVYIFIWMLFLALSCITYEKRHLNTDIMKYLATNQSLTKIIGFLVIVLTVIASVTVIVVGITPVQIAYLNHRFSDTGVFPMALIYLALPVGFLFNVLAAIFSIFHRKPETSREEAETCSPQ